jgi:hypothetical protein
VGLFTIVAREFALQVRGDIRETAQEQATVGPVELDARSGDLASSLRERKRENTRNQLERSDRRKPPM